jgi:predicted permease
VSPLRDALVRDSRKGLLVLSAAVGFVLLIVCINIANLTLVRATAKRQELAIRTALGAATRHLLQATVAESVLVAVCGTAGGLLLAWWLIDLVITTAPADLVSIQNVAVDANVFLFTSVLGALTALLFGLLPAWRVCRTARVDLVHVNGRGTTSGPQLGFLRSALVGAELAFGTVLLIGAGLLLASFHRVMGVSRGFDVDNIIAVDLSLPEAKYRTQEEKLSFFARVQERVQAIPAIGSVAYANGVPLTPPEGQSYVIRENKNTVAWEDLPLMTWWHTGGGYFSAMGIPLISGRTFSDQERELVAIVSEAAATRLWPGENPIGQKVRHPIDPDKTRWFQVIAVVGNVRDKALDHDPSPALYIPYWQGSCCRLHTEALTLVARTATDAKTIGRTIREQVWSVDREVAVPEVRTMERILSASVEKCRFHVAMLALFAAIALLLAVTGVFGVTTYAVSQRRRDIGIRIALGAKPRDVLAHVVGQGMKPIASGLAMGVIGAAALTQYLASLLFEVHALDPLTFAIIPLFLGATALLACYVPARQAAAIDPMKVLREQ